MFAISERERPCRPRLNPSSSGRSTTTVPSATVTRMFVWIGCVSSPFGPLTRTTLSSLTATSTPLGISTGFLPIRLISLPWPVPRSPHVGEDLAADPLLGRRAVRPHHARRGHQRDAEAPHHPRQAAAAAVDPAPGLGDPADPGDRPLLARAVLELHAERLVDALALLLEAGDVALLLEDLQDRARLLRHRCERLVLVGDVRVADPRQQVRDRVGHVRRHLLGGYHEAFVTPGSSPRCASSRKQMRQSMKRL